MTNRSHTRSWAPCPPISLQQGRRYRPSYHSSAVGWSRHDPMGANTQKGTSRQSVVSLGRVLVLYHAHPGHRGHPPPLKPCILRRRGKARSGGCKPPRRPSRPQQAERPVEGASSDCRPLRPLCLLKPTHYTTSRESGGRSPRTRRPPQPSNLSLQGTSSCPLCGKSESRCSDRGFPSRVRAVPRRPLLGRDPRVELGPSFRGWRGASIGVEGSHKSAPPTRSPDVHELVARGSLVGRFRSLFGFV